MIRGPWVGAGGAGEAQQVTDVSAEYERLRAKALGLRPGSFDGDQLLAVRGIFEAAVQAGLDDLQRQGLVTEIADRTGIGRALLGKTLGEMVKAATPRRVVQPGPSNDPLHPVVFDQDWRVRDVNGLPLPVTENLEVVLEAMADMWLRNTGEDPRPMVWWDDMSKVGHFGGPLAGMPEDDVLTVLHDACQRVGVMKMTKALIAGSLDLLAHRAVRHPFGDFLGEIRGEWDGANRFEQLLATVRVLPGVGESKKAARERFALVLWKWLMSIVAAARGHYVGKAGEQPRMVPVFLGGQFAGKTTWFSRLFEGLFPGSADAFLGGAEFTGDRDNRALLTSRAWWSSSGSWTGPRPRRMRRS